MKRKIRTDSGSKSRIILDYIDSDGKHILVFHLDRIEQVKQVKYKKTWYDVEVVEIAVIDPGVDNDHTPAAYIIFLKA
jgi:hypothetical protein